MDLNQFIGLITSSNTRDVKNLCYKHLTPLGIKWRYEMINETNNANSADKSLRASNDSYIIDGQNRRLILSTNRGRADYNTPIVRQSNGTILNIPPDPVSESPTVICMPPMPPNFRYNLRNLKRNVQKHQYHLYEIKDGTLVTLYWFNNAWEMATYNGYSVRNMVWMGNTTYGDIVIPILESQENFSWDNLDRNKSYTIGFSHPDYHPFSDSDCWFVQSRDFTTFEENFLEDIGLPVLPNRPLSGPTEIDEILNKCQTALGDFIKGNSTNPVTPFAPFFGYVCRSIPETSNTDASNADASNTDTSNTDVSVFRDCVILESSLLQKIREYIYNDHTFRLNPRASDYIGAENRLKYITIKAYLQINTRVEFLCLFPRYKGLFRKFDFLFNDIVSEMFNQLESTKRKEPIEHLAHLLVQSVQKDFNITIRSEDSSNENIRKSIREWISSVQYLEYFYPFLESYFEE